MRRIGIHPTGAGRWRHYRIQTIVSEPLFGKIPNTRHGFRYWIALYAEIDGEGAAAFMHQLLQRDISGVNIRQRPITEALREQKELSLDPIGEWWLDRLHAGYIRDPESGWLDVVATDDVREMIMNYAGVRSGFSRQIIVARLQEMCPSIQEAQKAVIPGAARRRSRVFPSLEVARKEFEAYIGHSMDWDD